jgi:prolyl oligopeptidase
MKLRVKILGLLACSGLLLSPSLLGQETTANDAPVAPARPVTDKYFGIEITDRYRYMEDLKSSEVQHWIKAQADYTKVVLDRLPGRGALLAEIAKYDNAAPARVRMVQRMEGPRYFYLKTLAGQNLAKLYMRNGLKGEERLLIDTDQYKGSKGEPAAINYYAPSPDGRYVVYGISVGGSEMTTLRVLDIQAGKNLPEEIDRILFGAVSWLPDSRGFFYNRLQKLGPEASPVELEQKSKDYLHTLGESSDKDVPVLGFELSKDMEVSPVDLPFVVAQPGSDYAIGIIAHGVQRELTAYAAALSEFDKPQIAWERICDTDAKVTDLAVHGKDMYVLTYKDASRFKLLKTSVAHPDLANAEVVVPEGRGVLSSLTAAADAVYLQELDGGVDHIVRVPYDGSASRLPLPFEGDAEIYPSDPRLSGALVFMTSWVKGPRIYDYTPQDNGFSLTDIQPAGPYDNPDDLTSEEVLVPSYDGTLVPLSIVSKKNLSRNGSNPTILEAYGAYGITEDPFFSPFFFAAMEHGAIYAVAHVRGGGEYGEDWHRGGYKLTKANTWRDLIACAQYMIDKKYTSTLKLAIWGGSAGGITIGRAITERPDLFAAAAPAVGLLNPVRAEAYANGVPNVPEFGSVKTQEGFEDLYAMDSYLHVRDGVAYPAVLLTTGMNDPRVTPWMPSKMAARLQAATSSGKPVLLRVDYEGGHGIGAARNQQEELFADIFSFFFWQFGIPDFQPNRR